MVTEIVSRGQKLDVFQDVVHIVNLAGQEVLDKLCNFRRLLVIFCTQDQLYIVVNTDILSWSLGNFNMERFIVSDLCTRLHDLARVALNFG